MGRLIWIAAFLLLAGCELLGGTTQGTQTGEHPIQTDVELYVLEPDGSVLRGAIPYVFTNPTDGAVYLVNCRGDFLAVLERREGGRWMYAYGNPQRDCLSPPIVISAGETYADTLLIFASPHGSNMAPQFDRADPTGSYRLVLGDEYALTSFDENAYPFGEILPRPHRLSNTFRIEVGDTGE